MNENDENFRNLLEAMHELGIKGDPYEIAQEYGLFDETFVPGVNYQVNYPAVPFVKTMSVEEIKNILLAYKDEHEY